MYLLRYDKLYLWVSWSGLYHESWGLSWLTIYRWSNKYEIFSFIKEKAFRRLHGWRHKFLSRAGKEILLKSIVQGMPSYVMRVFLIPQLLCADLERMMNSFWWGKTSENNRGLRWHSWDKLTFHKAKGGLGFRKIHEYNLALLAKQSWKLVVEPNYLSSQVLKSTILPSEFFLWSKGWN